MVLTKAVTYSQIENSLEAGKHCALSIQEKFGDRPLDFLFLLATIGHDFKQFGEPEPDVNAALETLDPDRDRVRFFTFGEIVPVANAQQFHNYTGVFVGIEVQ